jgi:hypothetical protein
MFWQVFSLDICLDKSKSMDTVTIYYISNTVAIPNQFENTDFDKLCILLNTCRFMYLWNLPLDLETLLLSVIMSFTAGY